MIRLFSRAACAAFALHAVTAWAQAPATAHGASPQTAATGTLSSGTSAATSFRYPEAGGAQPSSTLRVREIPVPGTAGTTAPAPVTDTPASVEAYQRCQLVGTRAATSNADMQGRIAQCLAELEARRRAGQ